MRKYITSSNKFVWYCLLIILDAINIALMAILLKQTLDVATNGTVEDLISTAILIIVFLIEYSVVSWGTRTIKAYYISDVMFLMKEESVKVFL